MRQPAFGKPAIVHPYAAYWEPLQDGPTFVLRSMFGTKAVYWQGRIVLCFAARKEPWRGVLVATERAHHAALRAQLPALGPHPILPKWLYIAESSDKFESTVQRLVELVRRGDPRIGVTPQRKR